MADRFLTYEELLDAISAQMFDRPPAIVANAHITGLGVARALSLHDVPVIAVDRNGDGVAPYSDSVDFAGQVTYPLEDEEGFSDDIKLIADQLDHKPIAFACMDEWVHSFARKRPEGVQLPFDPAKIPTVLNKGSLYAIADQLDVPFPETYRIRETFANCGNHSNRPPSISITKVEEKLGFPVVVKPELKRTFEEAVGTNVIEVNSRKELDDVVEVANKNNIQILVQERVPLTVGGDRTYVSYIGRDGSAMGIVGAPKRYPPTYGTSCLVDRVNAPALREHAHAVLSETGFYGISEAEFVHDKTRDEYVLLDINTRPWKWIGLPVLSGVNLPYAAYSDVVGNRYEPEPVQEARWVYLPDYAELLSEGGSDRLSREQWISLISGEFEKDPNFTTGVYDPTDPAPCYQLLKTKFGNREYYCAC